MALTPMVCYVKSIRCCLTSIDDGQGSKYGGALERFQIFSYLEGLRNEF